MNMRKTYNICIQKDYYRELIKDPNFSRILFSEGDLYMYIGQEKCIRIGSIHSDHIPYRIDVFMFLKEWKEILDSNENL